MPQAAPLAIQDGATTPVTHTFIPSKVSDLSAVYYGPGATLAGREQLVVTRREPNGNVAGKVNFKIVKPTEQIVDGVTSTAFQDLASVDFVLAPKGQAGDRRNIRIMLSNLLRSDMAEDVIDNFNGIF